MITDPAGLAFVGAGALGQAFAGFLASSGQPVTILGTQSRAAQLLHDRYVRLYGVQERAIPVAAPPAPAGTIGITADPAQLPAVDGLIFTTKAHQLPDAIAAVQRAWNTSDGQFSWVAGAQNGLAKDTMLLEAFGPAHVVGMTTILSGQSEPDGRINLRSLGMTYLGEFASHSSARVTAATAALNQAGIPATAADDIQSVLWGKACHAAGIFGTTATARVSLLALMSSPDLAHTYLALLRESAAIATASGIALRDYAGFPVRTYLEQPASATLAAFAANAATMRGTDGPEAYSSMAYDVVSGRALEVDQVFGDLVARAEQIGLAAPRLTLIRDILRGIDPGRKADQAQI
jgi:2-dehydropantoate 2-reductase